MDEVSTRGKTKGQRNRTDLHVTKEKAEKGLAIKRKLMEECKLSQEQSLAEIWNTGSKEMQKHLVEIMNQQT